MTNAKNTANDWLNAFLPLGCLRADSWHPLGGAVLMLDRPNVWLVTARQVIDALGAEDLSTWVPGDDSSGLLNLSQGQRDIGIDWIHHKTGLSAMLMPIDDRFRIKAFAEAQCTRVQDLLPLQPACSVGCLYGPDIEPQPYPTPAVIDGVISSANSHTGTVYTTCPVLPRNLGAPLLLASPYTGTVTLAGIVMGNAMLSESDPRTIPVRLGRAMCVDAALELIRGEDADEQRRLVDQTADEQGAPDQDAAGSKE